MNQDKSFTSNTVYILKNSSNIYVIADGGKQVKIMVVGILA